jgi:hypothetical protein
MLSFDEVEHAYHWCGVRVPNVTSVISPLADYSMIPAEILENARAEGVQIHKMIELDAKQDLDIDALPDWIRTYFNAWQQFKDDSGFEMVSSEFRMYHPTHQYAGTCDLVARLPKLKKANTGLCLIDVKRSLYAGPVIGLQLAAYADAWDQSQGLDGRIKHRFAFQPRKDGSYRLEEFNDPTDRMTFNALLTVQKWKSKHAK